MLSLFCPFPSQLHPDWPRLEREATAWADEMALLPTPAVRDRFVAQAYWRLMALTYPTVVYDDLRLITDWNSWGFMLDDQGDEGFGETSPLEKRQFLRSMLSVMAEERTTPLPAHPLLQALDNIWQRLLIRTTPAWRSRLRIELRSSFRSYEWEAINRAQHRFPSPAEYLAYRGATGAWLTYVIFAELFAGFEPYRATREMRRLLRAANTPIVLANDLFSAEKEEAVGDVHNLVLILQKKMGYSRQRAERLVVARHNIAMHHYVDLEQRVMAGVASDERLALISQFVRSFISGNLAWSLSTPRYHHAESQPMPIEVSAR